MRIRIFRLSFSFLVGLVLLLTTANAQCSADLVNELKRTAFILCVGNYPIENHLNNPANDARDLGEVLKRLHFNPDVHTDDDAQSLRKHIATWIASIPQDCDIALFY